MVMSGITSKEVAKILGINESTLYRKINSEGNFTRKEIKILIDTLGLKNPEEIFFT
jgi:predicted DNA-binding transcriptional regulator AlpA